MTNAIGALFNPPEQKPDPIVPAPAAPPVIDAARERQTTSDRLKFRRGAAATRLARPGQPTGRVGVYRALGGGASV